MFLFERFSFTRLPFVGSAKITVCSLSFGDIVLSFAFCVFEVLEVSDVCPILSSSSSCCLVFVFSFVVVMMHSSSEPACHAVHRSEWRQECVY